MCLKITEVYAVCKCLYYQHAIDRCPLFSQANHQVQVRIIQVGQTCTEHVSLGAQPYSGYGTSPPDSGYQGSTSTGKQ